MQGSRVDDVSDGGKGLQAGRLCHCNCMFVQLPFCSQGKDSHPDDVHGWLMAVFQVDPYFLISGNHTLLITLATNS